MALRWHSPRVLASMADEVEQRMERAMQYVEGVAKQSVSRGNLDGTNPSAPGEPPKTVTGNLRASIGHRVERDGNNVMGYIGANAEYARRLELGFVGRDSKGRLYSQGPRPFLRPAVFQHKTEILDFFKR